MTPLLEITHDDIGQLTDFQLTDLLRRLLHLEANHNNIAARSIALSLNITVPDGGEDGRVQWTGGPPTTDYFPNRLTMFQCKATDIGPTACGKELCRKDSDQLKPQVERVLDAKGSYVLLTTQALNQHQIEERFTEMRKAIDTARKPYAATADLHIYDANKIQGWTNCYIPAIIAVCLWCKRPLLSGMQTWESWSEYAEYQRFPFIPSDKSDHYIASLRGELVHARGIARIDGLSGLGKTRLALEVFRPAAGEENIAKHMHHRVVYIDDALGVPHLAATVADWCTVQGLAGILVVDNCNPRLHQQLETYIQHARSQLSLLTLDFEPQVIPGTPTIHLEPSTDNLIHAMLKQVYDRLPEVELSRIATYAQGFPRMGVLLANARLHNEPEMGSLRDEVLLEKLLWGYGPRHEDAEKVISACALFEHVGFSDDREAEYHFIAEHICRMDLDAFYSHVETFTKRGIIEKRGRYIRVVPLPLAVRLAADWWKHCRPERARQLLAMEMPGGLSEALCDRVAKLDFLPKARELVQDLCGDSGPFGQAEVLSSERGSRLFRSLAEVNPIVAAQTLERVFGSWQREALLHLGPGRRRLVWTLQKLCFRRDTFPIAARLLLAFAAAENEHFSNNATGIFTQLFHVQLSGTEAPPQERLPIIDEALASTNPYRRTLAVQALEHALRTNFFSRTGGAEVQGSGPALEDWQPRTWGELFEYWREALTRLTTIALDADELAEHARNAIAGSIRGLVSYGRLDELEWALTRIVAQHGPYWPKALEQVQQTIRFDGTHLPQEGQVRLDQWRQLLQPQSIPERLRLYVSIPAWRDMAEDEHGRSIDRAEERATALAEECARDRQLWLPHLAVLLEGEQRKAIAFGQRLGQCLEEPRLFIDRALMVLAGLPRERANPTVLSAFLRGLKARDPDQVTSTLNAVAEDRVLCHYLIDLTRLSQPALSDLERLLSVVRREGTPLAMLSALSYGSVLDHLSSDDLIAFTNELLAYGSEGAWVALDILFMYQFGADERWQACKQQLRKLLLHPNLSFIGQWREGDLYHWQDVAHKLLDEEDHDLARDLMKKMLAASAGRQSPVALADVFRPVLQVLLAHYRDTVWPILSEALLSDDVLTHYYVTDLLGARFAKEDTSGALFTVPEDFLLGWCATHPTRAPAALARIMPLFQRTGDTWAWQPLAQAIIDRYGNQEAVLSALTVNLGTYSWTGSLVPYYEKQVHPIEQLRHHRLPEARHWAGEHLRYVQAQIKQETMRDDERNFGIF